MADFPLYDETDAPEAARPQLEGAKKAFGFIPNLLGEMAAAPPVLEGYMTLYELVGKTTLSQQEQQVAILSVARENECEYCVGAHSATASMAKVPEAVITAIRDGDDVPDERLGALSRFVRTVVGSRGWPSDEAVEEFLAAGYTEANILEVMLVISVKTLSNYINHIAGTPLDDQFEQFAWSAPQAA